MKDYTVEIGFIGKYKAKVTAKNEEEAIDIAKDEFFNLRTEDGDIDFDFNDEEAY